LVYLLVLEDRDGGVNPEKIEDAGQAVMYLHCTLIVAVGEVLD
jgi:hypothetical protein